MPFVQLLDTSIVTKSFMRWPGSFLFLLPHWIGNEYRQNKRKPVSSETFTWEATNCMIECIKDYKTSYELIYSFFSCSFFILEACAFSFVLCNHISPSETSLCHQPINMEEWKEEGRNNGKAIINHWKNNDNKRINWHWLYQEYHLEIVHPELLTFSAVVIGEEKPNLTI